MRWWRRLLRPLPPNPQDTFREVSCGPDRRLPWDRAAGPAEPPPGAYACPWEARYQGRLRAAVEIAAGFRDFERVWGRMLEYGWTARRTLPGDDLLDVGSGDSPFPARLARIVRAATAMDRTDRSGAHATHMERHGVRYAWQTADARRIPFPDARFDCVTCVSVLEHIPSPGDAEAIAELARICRPGGRILISVPYSHTRTIEDASHPEGLQRYYAPGDLTRRFLIPGLELRDVNFVVFGMPEDGFPPRFGHPEEAGIVLLGLERR